MFAVWLMFGVLGIPIRKEFGLTDVQLAWITALAVLNGAIWRLPAGIITDRQGGRKVFAIMLAATAVPAYLVSTVTSYQMLLFYAFLVGFAGNSFSVGHRVGRRMVAARSARAWRWGSSARATSAPRSPSSSARP